MKEAKVQSHLIDILFVLALFAVFIITALLVALMGAQVYQSTVRNMNRNFDTQTSLTYISTKVRQNDAAGGIIISDIDGAPALVLEQIVGEEVYQTWIYHYDGYLREMFIKKGGEVTPDFGLSIMAVDAFSVEMESDRLLRVSTTDRNGNPVEALVATRSAAP